MLIHLFTNSPLTLFTGLCCPRFLFHICFTLSIFLFLVNCAMGNMHTQFKFKHTVSVINGQKKLHFTHRVHPVGISRYIGATGYPLLPFLGDLHAYSCGKCWGYPLNQDWFKTSHTPFFLANLSFVDVCYSSTITPKMLVDLFSKKKTISFVGCFLQMYFFIAFATPNASFWG